MKVGIGYCNKKEAFLSGKKVPIIGGSAIGIITNEDLSSEGHPAGALVVQSDTLRHRVAAAGNLNKDEKLAGKRLAEKLSNETEDKLYFLFMIQ